MYNRYYDSPYLMHHGIKGMRWGVRRYQNNDGSLKPAGRTRYGKNDSSRGRGGKRPLTAAQKAERKRKLIKGAKIAAAALGTAAVVGGAAYSMKKGSKKWGKFMQDLDDQARRSQAERDDLRRTSEGIRRVLDEGRRVQNNYRFNERDVDAYFMGNDRRDANQSFKDFNRRAGDANRSLGEAEARAREYRKGIQENMRQLNDMENVMNQIEEEMRRRNNGR